MVILAKQGQFLIMKKSIERVGMSSVCFLVEFYKNYFFKDFSFLYRCRQASKSIHCVMNVLPKKRWVYKVLMSRSVFYIKD